MFRLECHRANRPTTVRRVAAAAHRRSDGQLALHYALDADLDRLRIPAPRPARVCSWLWQHTCFEAFLRCEDEPAYHEINLSPSGEWAMYSFRRYRELAGAAGEDLAPHIVVRHLPGRLEMDAEVRLDRLRPAYRLAVLRVALAAVIEDDDGVCSYWSMSHPQGKPDFHHADAFALRLEPPVAT